MRRAVGVRPARCSPPARTGRIAEVWARLCALDVDVVARAIEREFFDAAGRDAVPVTDLDAFFADLAARGFVLGVATMDGEAAARAALDRLGAGRHLAFLCGGDSGWGTKPGPGMVHAFLAATGCGAGEVTVVGDNPHDMEMAARPASGAEWRSSPAPARGPRSNRSPITSLRASRRLTGVLPSLPPGLRVRTTRRVAGHVPR